MVNARP